MPGTTAQEPESAEDGAIRLLRQFHKGGIPGEPGALNPAYTALDCGRDSETTLLAALYLDPSYVEHPAFIVHWLREIVDEIAFEFGVEDER